MIVFDTDVASELIKAAPDPRIATWADVLATADTAITVITAAELRLGVALLPDGRRKDELRQDVEWLVDEVFGGRVLPFDTMASAYYAEIRSTRRRSGQPIHIGEAQIAATCLRFGATLATRNTKDFEGIGLELVNPWTAS